MLATACSSWCVCTREPCSVHSWCMTCKADLDHLELHSPNLVTRPSAVSLVFAADLQQIIIREKVSKRRCLPGSGITYIYNLCLTHFRQRKTMIYSLGKSWASLYFLAICILCMIHPTHLIVLNVVDGIHGISWYSDILYLKLNDNSLMISWTAFQSRVIPALWNFCWISRY